MKEDSVLVGWGWHNKVPWTGRLKQHRSILLQCCCLEASNQVVCQQGRSLLRPLCLACIWLSCLCPHRVLPVYGFVS